MADRLHQEFFREAGGTLTLHGECLLRILEARVKLGRRPWAEILKGKTGYRGAAIAPKGGEFQRVERAILRVSRLVPGSTCIHRSLSMVAVLRRRGSSARVVLGLRRKNGEVQGHAWVESPGNGEILRAFWTAESGYVEIADFRLASTIF